MLQIVALLKNLIRELSNSHKKKLRINLIIEKAADRLPTDFLVQWRYAYRRHIILEIPILKMTHENRNQPVGVSLAAYFEVLWISELESKFSWWALEAWNFTYLFVCSKTKNMSELKELYDISSFFYKTQFDNYLLRFQTFAYEMPQSGWLENTSRWMI